MSNQTAPAMSAAQVALACPLCGQAECAVAASLGHVELRRLWTHYGVNFSPRAWEMPGLGTRVERLACRACGFEFFEPARAGNEAFYEELHNQLPGYYPRDCISFQRTVRFAVRRGLRSVLDVGCGCGDFLDRAHEAGLRTSGLELNSKAAAAAAAKGHQVSACTLTELARNGGARQFDLVTAFEVLEHVPDPVAFMAEAAALLADGGFVAVTLPQRGGVHDLCPMEPHNWPPHHITRWRRTDLGRLGARCGLDVAEVGGSLLEGRDIEKFLTLRNDLALSIGHADSPWPMGLVRAVTFAYRKLGLKYLAPRRGLGMFAFLRKPAR